MYIISLAGPKILTILPVRLQIIKLQIINYNVQIMTTSLLINQ